MIIHLIVSSLAFWTVSRLVPGWKIKSFPTAILVALVYGVLSLLAMSSKFIAWICMIPFMLIIPKFVIGAILNFVFTLVLVKLTDYLVEDFSIENLPSAVVGVVVLNFLVLVLSAFLRF